MSLPTEPFGMPLGVLSGATLFGLAMGIIIWPMARRLAEARRQRVHDTRVAWGDSGRKG